MEEIKTSTALNKSKKTPEGKAARRQKMIQEYEFYLNNIKTKIHSLDRMDVDLNDEGDNSPQEQKCYLERKYTQFYKELCRATGCSSLTGRPIEKKINLTGVTPFPLLNEKVSEFMNSKSISFVPDFSDILNVVQHENQGSDPFFQRIIRQEEINATAEKLHRRIMNVLRSQRHQDFHIALPATPIAMTAMESGVKDPADSDENLREILEANRKEAITENQVVADFLAMSNILEANSSGLNAGENNVENSSGEDDDDDDGSGHSRFDVDEKSGDSDD